MGDEENDALILAKMTEKNSADKAYLAVLEHHKSQLNRLKQLFIADEVELEIITDCLKQIENVGSSEQVKQLSLHLLPHISRLHSKAAKFKLSLADTSGGDDALIDTTGSR